MARLVKAALAALLVFALVWTAVIVHWQATTRQPSGADIVLSLVLLPIALAALLFASIWAFKRSRVPAAGAAPAGSAGAQLASGAASASGAPRVPLAIVVSAIIGPAGHTSAELAAAFADGKLPGLDTELRDREGFPVFAARAAIEPALIEEWRALLAGRDTFAMIAAIDDEVLRTLALASMAIDALLQELATLPDFARVPDRPDEADRRKPQHVAPRWFVTLLLPPDWTDALRTAASALLGTRMEATLADLALHAGPREIAAPLVRQGVETMMLVDGLEARLAADTQRGTPPGVALIVAAASHIGESTLDAWQSRGTLYGAATPQGLVPGECAAGLVVTLASAGSPQSKESVLATTQRVHLHGVATGRREKPVDARGKTSADALDSVANRALFAAGPAAPAQPLPLAPERVACIVAESGPHTAHVLELAALVSERFPDLDPLADNWAIGSIQGHTGVAGTLAALCVAHACAIAREAPVLVASTSDRFERAAAVLTIAA